VLLEDRVAVVTGGGSGIGAATAAAFARHGAHVVVVDLDGDAAAASESAIRAAGGDARAYVADASRPEDLEELYGYVGREFGRLDVLHNNHVWSEKGGVGEVSLDGFRRSLDVGVTSYFHSSKLALRLMLPRRAGAIVNTASVCGLAGDYSIAAYNVLKAGVVNLSRSIALDYAQSGIRCNCVCPGPTATRPYEEMRVQDPDMWQRTCDAVPMGRLAEPAEIADAVLFLASDMARFVTGTALVVDGGLSAWSGLPALGSVADGLD
jgi:meso-butanediol dehydrogenase/(S,S)-butanediol dehydrogenase/diacetyl reductase